MLARADAARLVEAASPGARILSCRVLPGGLTNTNVLVQVDRPPGRLVLRLHQRDPGTAAKEQLILRLAGRLGIPAPPLLVVTGPDDPVHSACVLGWVDGEPLDQVLRQPGQQGSAGWALGQTLAAVHAVRFPHPGFLDGTLHPGEPIDMGPQALQRFLSDSLNNGAGCLGAALSRCLQARVERDAWLLATWPPGARLVHGDLNPGNILFRRESEGWHVSGLLDWEYALSASPALDFAALLRPEAGDSAAFLDALAAGYRDAGGVLVQQWQATARLADLFAWLDMLNRTSDPEVQADATLIIRRLLTASPP